MDAVNRRIAMRMMIDTAKQADATQFILITPQEMSVRCRLGAVGKPGTDALRLAEHLVGQRGQGHQARRPEARGRYALMSHSCTTSEVTDSCATLQAPSLTVVETTLSARTRSVPPACVHPLFCARSGCRVLLGFASSPCSTPRLQCHLYRTQRRVFQRHCPMLSCGLRETRPHGALYLQTHR